VFSGWSLFVLTIPPGNGSVVRSVTLPAGAGIRMLAAELEKSGIIRNAVHFAMLGRLSGQAVHLKAGDYRFHDGMTPWQVLRKVVDGDVDYRRFVLPEGYSIHQAAELAEQKGFFSRAQFLKACSAPQVLATLGSGARTMEGYLYPATYDLTRSNSAEELIVKMYRRFERAYATIEANPRISLTLHQVVTLASMIEKEAVAASEKPLISSVFHNRLRLKMPLQSDPTAVYGRSALSGKVTGMDVRRHSAYNTYQINGLPPGPIGNPGVDALRAALHPADTQYLYFVAKKDGTHHFSRNLEEHNRAVRQFLR